jgi:hypothetical protein
MKNLERRVQKIEALVPQLSCPNPEHGTLRIFMYGVTPEQDRENDELIKSIRNCEYCKAREATNKGPSIVIVQQPALTRTTVSELQFTIGND